MNREKRKEMVNYLMNMHMQEANLLIGWLAAEIAGSTELSNLVRDFQSHCEVIDASRENNFPDRVDDREPQSRCSSETKTGRGINLKKEKKKP